MYIDYLQSWKTRVFAVYIQEPTNYQLINHHPYNIEGGLGQM